MASVIPRRNPSGTTVWRVQFRVGGQMRQETFADAEAASAFGELVDRVGGEAARAVRDMRSKVHVRGHTLESWTSYYLTRSNGFVNNVQEGTLGEYRRIAQRSFLQFMGGLPLEAIGRSQVAEWIAWQKLQPTERNGQPLSIKTVLNYHGLLSSMLAAAVAEGHIDANPAYRATIGDGERVREPVFLSHREFGVLAAVIHPYYLPLLVFLASTGCRWGEATGLPWKNVNFESAPATVRITQAWKRGEHGGFVLGPPKTKRGRRTISIPAATAELLGRPGAADDLVFRGRRGGAKIWYSRFKDSIWTRAVRDAQDQMRCAELGLQPITQSPTPHDLRHSHASWLIAEGVPLPLIQARLGHEDISTTVRTYGHLAPEQMDAMALTVAGVLERAMNREGLPEVSPVKYKP